MFLLGLAHIAGEASREITRMLKIPTIGAGSGPYCDGASQLIYEIIGLNPAHLAPEHVKMFTNVRETDTAAIKQYIKETKERTFPG